MEAFSLLLWSSPSLIGELKSSLMNIELFGFSITAFLFWKLVGLAVLAFIVNFVYTWKTGRNLTDDRNRQARQEASATTPATQDREPR